MLVLVWLGIPWGGARGKQEKNRLVEKGAAAAAAVLKKKFIKNEMNAGL